MSDQHNIPTYYVWFLGRGTMAGAETVIAHRYSFTLFVLRFKFLTYVPILYAEITSKLCLKKQFIFGMRN